MFGREDRNVSSTNLLRLARAGRVRRRDWVALGARAWEAVCLLLCIYSVLVAPFGLAFWSEYPVGAAAWDTVVEALLLVDVARTLASPQTAATTSHAALTAGEARVRYARGYLTVDVLGSLPLSWLSALYPWAEPVRLLSALRVRRLRLYGFRLLGDSVGPLALVVIETIGMMVLLLHWTACAQFGHALRQEGGATTWLALSPNEGVAAAAMPAQYAVALFRAVCQMLALGYGRAAGIPASVGEVWLMLASMLLGGVLYAFMLAVGGAVLGNYDIAGTQVMGRHCHHQHHILLHHRRHRHSLVSSTFSQYNLRVEQAEAYMHHIVLPAPLRERVRSFYREKYPAFRLYSEEQVLQLANRALRVEMQALSCSELLRATPLFTGCEPPLLRSACAALRLELALPAEDIVRAGDLARHMYFIRSGAIAVVPPADGGAGAQASMRDAAHSLASDDGTAAAAAGVGAGSGALPPVCEAACAPPEARRAAVEGDDSAAESEGEEDEEVAALSLGVDETPAPAPVRVSGAPGCRRRGRSGSVIVVDGGGGGGGGFGAAGVGAAAAAAEAPPALLRRRLREEASLKAASRPVAVLEAGSYFGEVAVLRGGFHLLTCRALTLTTTHTLSRAALAALLADFPYLREALERVGQLREDRFCGHVAAARASVVQCAAKRAKKGRRGGELRQIIALGAGGGDGDDDPLEAWRVHQRRRAKKAWLTGCADRASAARRSKRAE